jgi:hypothetical protein
MGAHGAVPSAHATTCVSQCQLRCLGHARHEPAPSQSPSTRANAKQWARRFGNGRRLPGRRALKLWTQIALGHPAVTPAGGSGQHNHNHARLQHSLLHRCLSPQLMIPVPALTIRCPGTCFTFGYQLGAFFCFRICRGLRSARPFLFSETVWATKQSAHIITRRISGINEDSHAYESAPREVFSHLSLVLHPHIDANFIANSLLRVPPADWQKVQCNRRNGGK